MSKLVFGLLFIPAYVIGYIYLWIKDGVAPEVEDVFVLWPDAMLGMTLIVGIVIVGLSKLFS